MKILTFSFSDYQLPVVACIFLFFAMIAYWISLLNPKNTFFFQFGKIFVLFSNLLFALTLLLRWIAENYFPLSNLYESLIFLSWGISTIHLFIEFQTKSRLIGCIVTPILFFIAEFSSLTLPTDMQKALPLVPSLQSNWLMMHVTMMMISYATLIVGSLLSLLYLALITFDSSAARDLDTKTNLDEPKLDISDEKKTSISDKNFTLDREKHYQGRISKSDEFDFEKIQLDPELIYDELQEMREENRFVEKELIESEVNRLMSPDHHENLDVRAINLMSPNQVMLPSSLEDLEDLVRIANVDESFHQEKSNKNLEQEKSDENLEKKRNFFFETSSSSNYRSLEL